MKNENQDWQRRWRISPAGVSRVDGSVRIGGALLRDNICSASQNLENDASFWLAVGAWGAEFGGKQRNKPTRRRARRSFLSQMDGCGGAEARFARQAERYPEVVTPAERPEHGKKLRWAAC